MTPTRIVFPAILEFDQFASAEVNLGEMFPLITIVLVDSSKGLHDFKITKLLPHTHPTVLDSAVAEAKQQIEHFWTVLAFVRDTVIRPTGDIFFEFNDQRQQFNQRKAGSFGKLVGVASAEWFNTNKAQMVARYDLDRIKRLNFACSLQEPIGRFIALYALLLTLGNDRQSEVDKLILGIEPSTQQTLSPKNGQPETIYTRLRNELAHERTTATVFSTHDEIVLHLNRFEWIVKSIVRPAIQ